jgi:phosphodiesterase/alkaline phosphatase D-like protein
VLANVPTLMIFDDHEITDAWNLDHPWAAAVYGDAQAAGW